MKSCLLLTCQKDLNVELTLISESVTSVIRIAWKKSCDSYFLILEFKVFFGISFRKNLYCHGNTFTSKYNNIGKT